ncbi:MAG: DNA translocase FtsK 4TM domain-containing protein [Rhodospirillales bacterium]|nr:DNA translocase FtsK 4TM domain-containing protein [Rhodospirillales bacterium]
MIRAGTLAILPAGAAPYFKRRVAEAGGCALFVAGLTLFLALASFDPGDPSFNHATGLPTLNLFGRPGAFTADFLLHGFGWAALVPVLGLLGWAWRLFGRRPMRRLGLQAASLLLAIVLLATALAAVPALPGWPIAAGSGGAFGVLALQVLAKLIDGGSLLGRSSMALVSFAAGMLALGFGMGVSLADWRLLAKTLRDCWLRLKQWAIGTRNITTRAGEFILRRQSGRAFEKAVIEDGAPGEARPVAASRASLVDPKPGRLKPGRKTGEEAQGALDFETARYRLPPLDLLHMPTPLPAVDAIGRGALEQNAMMLKTVLDDFGVRGDIIKVRPGPVITLYELEPAPGTKSSRVIALADDIARSMSAVSARVAVVSGRNAIGIELPNARRETVGLRELLASDALERAGGSLMLALGKDIGGTPVIVDLARMPHLLIAGTTGSGKSVGINAMILSLLYRLSPESCKLILIDPKMLELSVYDGIPHLLAPVVTEPGKAVVALKWTVREMEERYRSMSQLGVRNIAGFNSRIAEAKARGEALKRRVQTGFDDDGKPRFEDLELNLAPLPLIVVVVDEMADLMLVAGKDIEAAVQRLSQMARAAGIHLIMATQRPSVDVITGTIKANFPTRISFQVTSKIDSRTILGEQGAEQLLGQGDMLFMAPGGRVTRVHGPFVSDGEVEAVVKALKAQGEPQYVEAVTEAEDEDEPASALVEEDDSESAALYREAVEVVLRDGKASTSFVQRRLQIGYNRAARLVERMEAEGLVSKADRVGRREILQGERAN